MQPNTQDSQPLKVIIAGGGVAGLESAFALHELAADRVAVTLIAPGKEFIYRPLSIGEPFTSSWAERYPLAPLAAAAGAELVHDTLASVDPEPRTIRTGAGTELSYDALILGLGTSLRPYSAHATNVDDTRMEELLHGLVQDIEGGYAKRLAIVIPGPMPWPFPAYELALIASERAWDTQGALEVTVLTPNARRSRCSARWPAKPLAKLLADRRIEVVTSAYCEVPRSGVVVVHPGGRTVAADRIVAFPQLVGPEVSGLPSDGGGFIPVDAYARVRDVDRVSAAGDGTDYPVKQGGVAAQLADTAAQSIAVPRRRPSRGASVRTDRRGCAHDGRDRALPAGDARWPRRRRGSPSSPSSRTEPGRPRSPPGTSVRISADASRPASHRRPETFAVFVRVTRHADAASAGATAARRPAAAAETSGSTSTGHGASPSSCCATLPATALIIGARPRVPTISSPACDVRATAAMWGAGEPIAPRTTCSDVSIPCRRNEQLSALSLAIRRSSAPMHRAGATWTMTSLLA